MKVNGDRKEKENNNNSNEVNNNHKAKSGIKRKDRTNVEKWMKYPIKY